MPAVIPFIPAIAGVVGGLLSGGKGPKQTTQQTQNPEQQAAWQAAMDWANKGKVPDANPLTGQATGNYQNAANAGNLGTAALSGDQGAYNTLANPFQQNVLDAMKAQYGVQNQNVMQNAADQAQGNGAWGGNRAAIMQGMALSNNQIGQGGQMANLMQSGFENTMNRAGAMAQMGLGAAGQLQGIGDYLRQIQQQQDPLYHKYSVLQSGLQGQPGAGQVQQSSIPAWQAAVGGGLQGLGAKGSFGGGGGKGGDTPSGRGPGDSIGQPVY